MTAKQLEKSISEIWELFKETDRKFKETDRKFKETDRRLAENALRLDEEIGKVSKSVGDLTGKWGKFLEGIIAPSAIRMFKERGIQVEELSQRRRVYRNGDTMEIDLLAENSNEAVVIEVKSTLTVNDVKEFLERLAIFKQYFPKYANHHVYGAVAGIDIQERSDRFAYKNGLFVIRQKGDLAEIVNDKNFKPKVW